MFCHYLPQFQRIIIVKGSSIFSSLSRAYKTYAGWEGVQGECTLFPKFKDDDIISAKSYSFYWFFICTLLGGREGVYKKCMFCTLMKMMKKMDNP